MPKKRLFQEYGKRGGVGLGWGEAFTTYNLPFIAGQFMGGGGRSYRVSTKKLPLVPLLLKLKVVLFETPCIPNIFKKNIS